MAAAFTCYKNGLTALNALYLLVSVILIAVGAYAKTASYIESPSITGGIVAAGVFLLLVSVLGFFGAVNQSQVGLFFYMILLFLVFLMQFAIAVACLAVNDGQRSVLAEAGWQQANAATKAKVQLAYQCCGYSPSLREVSSPSPLAVQPNCSTLACCAGDAPKCSKCADCAQRLNDAIAEALRVTGCVGLFFSFTELAGIWLAMRYRNLKNPRANPNAFL